MDIIAFHLPIPCTWSCKAFKHSRTKAIGYLRWRNTISAPIGFWVRSMNITMATPTHLYGSIILRSQEDICTMLYTSRWDMANKERVFCALVVFADKYRQPMDLHFPLPTVSKIV